MPIDKHIKTRSDDTDENEVCEKAIAALKEINVEILEVRIA